MVLKEKSLAAFTQHDGKILAFGVICSFCKFPLFFVLQMYTLCCENQVMPLIPISSITAQLSPFKWTVLF